MWGTDLTNTVTTHEDQIFVFVAADRYTSERVGIIAVRLGPGSRRWSRSAKGSGKQFAGHDRDVTNTLAVRHDHGAHIN
jgi:hypothetical protein